MSEDAETLIFCLVVADATRAVDFYKRAFGVRERRRITLLTGEIVCAELELEGSEFCVCDDLSSRFASGTLRPIHAIRQTNAALLIYSDRIEALWKRAILAGARMVAPIEPQPWGEERGLLLDPFGNQWCLARRLEHLTRKECEQRLAEALRTNLSLAGEMEKDLYEQRLPSGHRKTRPVRNRRQ